MKTVAKFHGTWAGFDPSLPLYRALVLRPLRITTTFGRSITNGQFWDLVISGENSEVKSEGSRLRWRQKQRWGTAAWFVGTPKVDHPRAFHLPHFYDYWARLGRRRPARMRPESGISFVASNTRGSGNLVAHRLRVARQLARWFPMAVSSGLRGQFDPGLKVKVFDVPRTLLGKYDFLSKFAFNLCFENSVGSGYLTEKLFDALISGSVPIYQGAPDVKDWVDEGGFINCEAASVEEIADRIRDAEINGIIERVWVERERLIKVSLEQMIEQFSRFLSLVDEFCETRSHFINASVESAGDSGSQTVDQGSHIQGDFDGIEINFVSYSLFGNDPRYIRGAVENARLVPIKYPGWRAIFYVDDSVPPEVRKELEREKALVRKGVVRNPYLYRLQALAEPHAGRVLFRDADSRITAREVEAVHAWVKSGKPFHSMRDHPKHTAPLMAGMWGAIARVLPGRSEILAEVPASRRTGDDQFFLKARIWPLIREETLEHDFCRGTFPLASTGDAFVGERIDASGQPCPRGRRVRSNWIASVSGR